MSRNNLIWIELDLNGDVEHCFKQIELANKMLLRLGFPKEYHFFWHSDKKMLCVSEGITFLWCPEKGHWFNLDFCSGEQT